MSRVENAQGSIEFINEQQADKIVPLFKQAVETNNPSLIKVVAYHNKTVRQWNQIIRHKVYGDKYSPNPLPGDILMMTDTYNDPASDDAKPLLFNSEWSYCKITQLNIFSRFKVYINRLIVCLSCGISRCVASTIISCDILSIRLQQLFMFNKISENCCMTRVTKFFII